MKLLRVERILLKEFLKMETLAQKLANDIIIGDEYSKIYNKLFKEYGLAVLNLSKNTNLTEEEIGYLLRCCEIFINTDKYEFENKALTIITAISLLNINTQTESYIRHVFFKMGNFPAISVIGKRFKTFEVTLTDDIYESYKRVRNHFSSNIYLTDNQLEILDNLVNSRQFSFSGPTSVGKSFIIKCFIKHILKNVPKENIVALVPTKALINQYVADFKKDLKDDLIKNKYKIAVSSTVENYKDSNLLLVLTPERLTRYLANKDNPSIGYIFVDEAQKITSTDDVRSLTTFRAVEKIIKLYPGINTYFASPLISNPDEFLKLFSLDTSKYLTIKNNTVSQHIFKVDFNKSKVFYSINNNFEEIGDLPIEISDDIQFIKHIGSNSNALVYCHSVATVIENAQKLQGILTLNSDYVVSDKVKDVIKKIKEFVHKDYILASLLEYGIAFHYGNLPQVIRILIEDLYKECEIKYLFTTSTLLEGINLPTTNLFILSNKKGIAKLDQLDFWNLSGRAGRMNIELNGNVFYIVKRDEMDKYPVLPSKDIKVEATISTRLNKNKIKIKKSLEGKEISGTESEKEQLHYIKNMICVDIKVDNQDKNSYILKTLQNNKDIIDIANSKAQTLLVPNNILYSNEWIDVDIQNSIYTHVVSDKKLFPLTVDYNTALEILERFYYLYNWEKNDSRLNKISKLKYYALLVNQRINGISLSKIIFDSIEYNHSNNKEIYKYGKSQGVFSKTNPQHVNQHITEVIDDIEDILRYRFEKYFNHYYQVLENILGKGNAGPNWAKYLEYGTSNPTIIALEDLGLSRYTSQYIAENYSDFIKYIDGEAVIDIENLLTKLNPENISYVEVSKLL